MKPCIVNIRPSSISRKDVGNAASEMGWSGCAPDLQQSGWVSETRRPGLAAPARGYSPMACRHGAYKPAPRYRPAEPERHNSGPVAAAKQAAPIPPARREAQERQDQEIVRRLAMSPARRCCRRGERCNQESVHGWSGLAHDLFRPVGAARSVAAQAKWECGW
jgi:hypothetical protein